MASIQNPGGMRRESGGQNWDQRLRQMEQAASLNLHEGAVTAGYKGNKEEILDLLNRALASEWASFLQYWHHYYMASDIHGMQVREIWKEHADEEYSHARKFNERINQLGGVPANSPQRIQELNPAPFEEGHDLRSMIQADLIGERQAIDFYSEVIRICGFEDSATRRIFEEALVDENEHANELSNLLFQMDASTGEVIPTLHEQAQGQKGQQGQAPGQQARERGR